jgi:membrane-associated phospholipid phosphatase
VACCSARWRATATGSPRAFGFPLDHTNNILALAFGLLIVFLVIGGSCLIIANLNANLMPM